MTFVLNAMGLPTAEQTLAQGGAVARQQTKAYDELGRLIRSIGASGTTWQFAYDAVGNLIQTTDARGKQWNKTVDNFNRTKTATNPQSQTESQSYTAFDEDMTQFKDGRNLATNMVVDGFGQTIQEASPDTATTRNWYDEAGRVTQSIDADAITTAYSYDAAGRTLSETSSGATVATQTVTYTYDAVTGGNKGVGRLTGVTDPSGTTAWTYDAQGRVITRVKMIKGLGRKPPPNRTFTFSYAYDANGAVTAITYPSGHVVDYTNLH